MLLLRSETVLNTVTYLTALPSAAAAMAITYQVVVVVPLGVAAVVVTAEAIAALAVVVTRDATSGTTTAFAVLVMTVGSRR